MEKIVKIKVECSCGAKLEIDETCADQTKEALNQFWHAHMPCIKKWRSEINGLI